MLKQVLLEPQIVTTVKLHAIISIGDIALFAESQFLHHMDEIMKAFFDASQNSLASGDTEEEVKIFAELRESLIDGYISILHGFFSTGSGAQGDLVKENYALQMFYYIQSLVNSDGLKFSGDILKNMIELYTDIVLMFAVKGNMMYLNGTQCWVTPLCNAIVQS